MARIRSTQQRRGVSALLKTAATTAPGGNRIHNEHRQLIADFCRLMLGDRTIVQPPAAPIQPLKPLAPRVQQTLELLLLGEGEKQIARRLKLSPHTVHVYVKTLYKSFDVCTRSELMAKFLPATPAPNSR